MGVGRLIRQAFSSEKTVDSPFLNRLGLQAARTIGARAYYRLRPFRVDPVVLSWVAEAREQGLLLVPGFHGDAEFAELRSEVRRFWQAPRGARARHQHGATVVEHWQVDEAALGDFPAIRRHFRDPRLWATLAGVEKQPVAPEEPSWIVERVTVGPADGSDPETELHVDTFHHTHKAWLFLEDVARADGPLGYVRRSNHLTFDRLKQVWAESRGRNQRSPRIAAAELAASGLVEAPLACAANTLAVVDVSGFHRRTPGVAGRQRLALLVSVRRNPFLPPAWEALLRRVARSVRGS